MAAHTKKYYKDSPKWRRHEEEMAAIAFLTESCKADPEFKYFLGAAGGFAVAAVVQAAKASGFDLKEETPEEKQHQMNLAVMGIGILKGGGDIASIAGLTFSGFCMLIILLKNLDGVAKIVAGAAEIIPF